MSNKANSLATLVHDQLLVSTHVVVTFSSWGQVNAHNAREKVRSSKIKTDDIAALKNVLGMSPWFIRRLKVIYQYQSPHCTAVPTQLLAPKFLNPSREPSVKREELGFVRTPVNGNSVRASAWGCPQGSPWGLEGQTREQTSGPRTYCHGGDFRGRVSNRFPPPPIPWIFGAESVIEFHLTHPPKENPLWHSIEEFSQEKADAWLARTDGRFVFKVQEQVSKGKKPNLQNMAGSYRDTGNEHQVWLMACMKVWAWPEAVTYNSSMRLDELEKAWQRGALDETMRGHIIAKRKDLKPTDLTWVGAQCHGVEGSEASGVLAGVDPLGLQQQQLTDAQRKSMMGQFEEWSQTLKIEGGKHKLWLTEVEAFDSKTESDMQRLRNERALTKATSVETLCNSWYSCQGFTEKQQAWSYLAQRLVAVSDVLPSRPASSVLRLVWADMAQLGLAHSRHVDEIMSYIKLQCESHPEVTAAMLCMPNTPKSGKGLKSDALRDINIKEAVDEVKNMMLTYSGIVHEKVHAIVHPESMYSMDRPVTLEFSEVISQEKHTSGEFRSLFAKGYTFRRRGVPELVNVMHRSKFLDMSSKMSAASRGNLGEEKERKHWNSGRQLYKVVLKYIFEGMGLTPGARAVIQHMTAWDPEFAAACMELNAAKDSSMPTIMYVATGWTPSHPTICKNMQTMMADELGNQIEKGTYTIPGYDANWTEPASARKRPELDDSMFKICKPRFASKELAITETELTKAKTLFSLDPALKKTFEETVAAFNKQHNPSGVPWKEKRPSTTDVASAESGSRGVFLPPCSKTVQELVSEGAHVFSHVATPRANMAFQLLIASAGTKIYFAAEQDGVFYYPLGRFVGSFLQGQPAKSTMAGGSQWIEWKYDNLDALVVASKKESSMTGPDMPPSFPKEPKPMREFFDHLDKRGKSQYNMVSHKMERDDIGKVTSITPDEVTCLPLPTSAPAKKKPSLDNIAGYIDIDVVKKSKHLMLMHNLVYSAPQSYLGLSHTPS